MDPNDSRTYRSATTQGAIPAEPLNETVALAVHTRGEWWTLYHLPLPGGLRYGQLWLPTPRGPEDVRALERLFMQVMDLETAVSAPAEPASTEKPVLRLLPELDEPACGPADRRTDAR